VDILEKEIDVDEPIKFEDIALSLGKKQKQTSIAEFFQKNRQFLGFGNKSRNLLMALKEMIDNSLDACNEAYILPEINIAIEKWGKFYKLTVQDNGPGIIKDKINNIFGRFLYGSKFHILKQTRGQQGIGITAVVMESLTSTGNPITIISKISSEDFAIKKVLTINVKTNQPKIIETKKVNVDFKSGTILGVILEANFAFEGKHGIKSWLQIVSIVNPDTTINFKGPSGEELNFERSIEQSRGIGKEINLHPNNLNLNQLQSALEAYPETIFNFLLSKLYGLTQKQVVNILLELSIIAERYAKTLSKLEISQLLDILKDIKVAPTTEMLNLIKRDNFLKSLTKTLPYNFISTASSLPKGDEGNIFVIEGGLVYDKEGSFDQKIEIIRIANNVPLFYQQGACLLYKNVCEFNWKNVELSQTKNELPYGPIKLFLHVAAIKIKFTSESKDAIADSSVFSDSIKEVLEKLNKDLLKFRKREKLQKKKEEKEKVINEIFPKIVSGISNFLDLPEPPVQRLYSNILDAPILFLKKHNDKIIIKIINNNREKYNFIFSTLEVEQLLNYSTSKLEDFIELEYNLHERLIINESTDKVFFIKSDKDIIL